MPWLLIALIVSAIYWAMASKQEAKFTAVRIVRDIRVSTA
jgi:hypothetical protein